MRVCILHVIYRKNVGYASTCASMGQVLGIMISSVSCILLTSEDFSNKYLRIMPNVGGIMTMKSKTTKKLTTNISINSINKKMFLEK